MALAHEELDKAVYTWLADMRARNLPISGSAVQQKALNYAYLLGIDLKRALAGSPGLRPVMILSARRFAASQRQQI